MNTFFAFAGLEVWHIAGWTMLHYLWLGALVGVVALVSRALLHRAAPNVRYTVALGWLMLLAILPIGIAAWLVGADSPPFQVADPPRRGGVRGGFVDNVEPVATAGSIEPKAIELSDPDSTLAINDADIDTEAATKQSPYSEPSPSPSLIGRGISIAALEQCVPYLPWVWLVGTPMTFALLTAGLVGTKRLRRASRAIDDGPITTLLSRLASSLRITHRVSLAVCDRIASPVLVGIVRPIILLPPAALTGWSPDEIEMVLLHELAHVRRWDNLVNLIQRLIESLLFFHPAVWLISTWVRRERETCCDAFVVGRTLRPHAYAELLVALSAQLCEPSEPGRPRPRFLTVGASSAISAGPLRSRIRRILQLEDDPMLISGKSLTLMLATLFIAATLAVLYLPALGQAEESTTEATESTGKDLHLAAQEKTQKNLKRLIMAVHNNHANRNSLPAHAIYDTDEKPLLSWRVHLLPFLAEEQLYREFHLDEPWDSEHNRKLIGRMPDVFKNPKVVKPGVTNYLAVVGQECVFNGTPAGLTFSAITDGTSKTIAIVEADADSAVVWTKPQDWEFDRSHPVDGLGSVWGDHWYAAWVDGSVRPVDNSEPADAIGHQFTRAGRELKSLQESANRSAAGGPVGEAGSEGLPADPLIGYGPAARAKFPSLDDQKLADVAWKRLRWELEPIGDDDLKRVQTLGYEGGLKVGHGSAVRRRVFGDGFGGGGEAIQVGDILVGLHVWPTTTMKSVAELLSRDDLAELSPLKFYAVRREGDGPAEKNPAGEIMPPADIVITGRVSVQFGSGFGGMGTGPGRTEQTPSIIGPAQSQPATAPSVFSPASATRPASAQGLIVYFFHAEDSLPSRRMKPIVERIAKKFYPVVRFLVMDVAEKPETAKELNVDSVPTCIIVRDRKVINRLVGIQSDKQLHDAISSALNAWTDSPVDRPAAADAAVSNPDVPSHVLPPAEAEAAPPPKSRTRRPRAHDPNTLPLPTNAAPPLVPSGSKSALRYDGKSFDDWRTEWQTELSTKKRLDAVIALAAFGRAGYDKEAVDASLDVAGEYDFNTIDNTGEGSIKNAVLNHLAPYGHAQDMARHWVPNLTARLAKEPQKWQSLAIALLHRLQTDDKDTIAILRSLAEDGPEGVRRAALGALVRSNRLQSGGPQIDDTTQALLTASLKSKDPAVILSALDSLYYQPVPGGIPGTPQLVFQPELVPLLFHSDKKVQQSARYCLARIQEDDAPQVVESLLAILKDDSRQNDHLAAVRALGAIGPHAEPTVPQLERILEKSDDMALRVAAGYAIDAIEKESRGQNQLLQQSNTLSSDEKEQARFIQLMNAESGIQEPN
ncbi:MAG: DUF1559 domain-containing protein [Planctomycetes bacterium]|nr:DUF1559 domain-containing protein [Planctomycetota bacterium]